MSNVSYNSLQSIERRWSETTRETQALKDRALEVRNRQSELDKNRHFASYPSDSRQSAESRWADTVKITQSFKDEASESRRLQAELKREQRAVHYNHYGN